MDTPFDFRHWAPASITYGTHALNWVKFDDGYTYRWRCGCEICDSWVDHWIIMNGHGTLIIDRPGFTEQENERMYREFKDKFNSDCEYEQLRPIRVVHDQ